MIVELQLFYLFSFLTLTSAFMVIGSRNPIHSVIFLILVFCNAAGLLVLLQVEFLAMIFLIVYVGAIAVLFLFVVMMLNIKIIELNENLIRYLPIGSIIGLIFLLELFLILDKDLIPLFNLNIANNLKLILWSLKVQYITNIEVLGSLLYTYYFYLFIVASLILLVAMIGAIVLTLTKETKAKRQDIFSQVSRNIKTIKYIS